MLPGPQSVRCAAHFHQYDLMEDIVKDFEAPALVIAVFVASLVLSVTAGAL